MEELLKAIEEQMLIGFTGKLNLLDPTTKQYFGEVTFQNGALLSVKYKNLEGHKAFFQIFIDLHKSDHLQGIVEPEIVDHVDKNIFYTLSKLKENLTKIIKDYDECTEQKPPSNANLLVDEDFMASKESVSGEEFSLLCTIVDYSSVNDIYYQSKLLEYEVTKALVSLRKKGAIKVAN